ncbi:hypothetical protein [Pedobacter nanyangensis]|uniref:hypothetical protein n=1 Tax=Pedobacter nanyangensis TaxID=1562389 RepID=UPI000DE1F6DC|nr:hypothetical protein [Pedobacter nanyangensis]
MYDTILTPDFTKLSNYFTLTEQEQIEFNKFGGVPAWLDYQTEDSFKLIEERFKAVCSQYGVEEHFNELFYLLIKKNEDIRVRYDAYWNNYNDNLTTREVAKFLLAYKEADGKTHLSLSIKPNNGATASIKDNQIVRWMCGAIVEKLEKGDYTFDVFGEKLAHDLFGTIEPNAPLDLQKLRAAASTSPRKPTVRINRLLVELCRYLQDFLIAHTILTMPKEKLLTDAQANFFFDTLEALGYLDNDTIQSDPKDYMWALFNNYVNYYKSRQ